MTQMQQAYGQMLAGYPWTFWFTGSLALARMGPDACVRAFRHYVNRIEQQCGANAYYFVVVEAGRLEGRRHLHALIGGLAAVPHKFARGVWELYGHPTLEPYDQARGASYYIVKHVVGPLEDDHYWLGGDWPAR